MEYEEKRREDEPRPFHEKEFANRAPVGVS
jgi:hypothetical protein